MNVGILGCGWLGLALGKQLIKKGIIVRGSSTQRGRLEELEDEGLVAFPIKVGEKEIRGNLDFFKELDVLILSIPPGRKRLEKNNFSAIIAQCCLAIDAYEIPRVIFLSSISVYGNQEGVLDETTPVKPVTEAAKQLVKSEEKIQKITQNNVIIRLGGLIGKERHPIRQLSGKKVGNPNGYINFIHQDDAVGILLKVIEIAALKGFYNAVTPAYPRRKQYYLEMAKRRKLPPPEFINSDQCKRKVLGVKFQKISGFKFSVNNLLI